MGIIKEEFDMYSDNCNVSEVYDLIKSGFRGLRYVMREDLKKHWKQMTKQEQYTAARSLALLNHIAKKPEKYFARKYTQAAWNMRAKEYANQAGLRECLGAFYIVQDPVGIVYYDVSNGLCKYVSCLRTLYNFSREVQDWEYSRTSSSACCANIYAENIVDFEKKISAKVSKVKPGLIKRKLLQLCR